MALDLNLLKKHIQVEDYDGDDDYLSHLLSVAQDYVINSTNRSYEELIVINGELPVMLQEAVLLVAGHLYANREGVSKNNMIEVPYTIQALIKPYRKLS